MEEEVSGQIVAGAADMFSALFHSEAEVRAEDNAFNDVIARRLDNTSALMPKLEASLESTQRSGQACISLQQGITDAVTVANQAAAVVRTLTAELKACENSFKEEELALNGEHEAHLREAKEEYKQALVNLESEHLKRILS
eukprot:scaffold3316_cov390-Prasinococcus_capsulatus_cf.AAC.3